MPPHSTPVKFGSGAGPRLESVFSMREAVLVTMEPGLISAAQDTGSPAGGTWQAFDLSKVLCHTPDQVNNKIS